MQLNEHQVDTAVTVSDSKITVVTIKLADTAVIGLFQETMKGFCPVCAFNRLSEGRHICDECLEKEKVAILPLVYATPYKEAFTRIVQYLLPATSIGADPTVAMTHLGVYTGIRSSGGDNRKAAINVLVKLGAWVIAQLTRLLASVSPECL